jgi:hypothetical protein
MKALIVIAVAGCSQHVYSPPSQAYSLGGVRSLDDGQQAVDLEASQHAALFDPAIQAGGARFRAGFGDNTEGSLEGAVMAVNDDGPSKADRQIYVGRAGVRTNPGRGPFAIFGGIGGGYAPAGGEFVTADGGIAVGYTNCRVVPMAQASVFASDPLHPTPIDVTVDSDHTPTMSTPHVTFGSVIRAGLRFSMSPTDCRAGKPVPWLSVGADATTVVDFSSHANLGGIGIGLEIPL